MEQIIVTGATGQFGTAAIDRSSLRFCCGVCCNLRAIKQGEFDIQKNDLEMLLGRKPTTAKEYFKTVFLKEN